MALFKISKGKEENLDTQPIVEGYAWFTEDGHNLYIDISATERVQVNAGSAEYAAVAAAIQGVPEGETTVFEINIDDILAMQDDIANATSVAFTGSLTVAGWTLNSSDNLYHQTIAINNLSCGSSGSVPPVISYLSNVDEYSLIVSAVATAGTGIDFAIEAIPTAAIDVVIIDVK